MGRPILAVFVGNHKNCDNHTIPDPGFQGGVLYKIHKTILGNLPMDIGFKTAILSHNIQICFFGWIVLSRLPFSF